jgi:hypothetical protein
MSDTTGAIYTPPKSGLPFLVVTFSDGAIHTQTAANRAEARALLARRTRLARASEIAAEIQQSVAKQ